MKTSQLVKAGLLLTVGAGELATTAHAGTGNYPFQYQLNKDSAGMNLQAATDVAVYAPMYSAKNYVFVADAVTSTVTRYLLNDAGNKVGPAGSPFTFIAASSGMVIEAIAVNDIPGHPNQGQLYVAEGNPAGTTALINVYNLNGVWQLMATSSTPAFTRITGMEVDRDGEVYVSDQTLQLSLKFDESNFYVGGLMPPMTTYPQFTGGTYPLDVTVSTCGMHVFQPDDTGFLSGNNNNASALWTGPVPTITGCSGADAHDPNEQVWVSFGSGTQAFRYTVYDCRPTSLKIQQANTGTAGGGTLTAAGHMEFKRFFNFPALNAACHERLFVCDGKRVAVFSQNKGSNVKPPSMSAWWKFNDMVNGTCVDSIFANNGTFPYPFRPHQLEGLVGGAFEFTAANDGVLVPDAPELDMGTRDFTVECWVKSCDEIGIADLLDKRDMNGSAAIAGYSMFLYFGKLGFQVAGNNTWANYVSPPNVTDCKWHHCAAVVNRLAGTITLYNDGLPSVYALPGWLNPTVSLDNAAALLMGRHPVTSPAYDFEGCLDEVTLYKRALTSAEILQIFNADCAGKAP